MQRDTATADVVLADGTRLDDLFDRERRALSARVYSDPEIFELELARIFAKAWIPVAHVSELSHAGDFVTRAIGRDPVIVTRDADGGFHVLLNFCTHRGSPVCRAELGNTRTHTCPFHGWAFGADGRLMGVPFERLIYGDVLDKPSLGLRRARVGVVAGIVFASWDEDGPDLDTFLGDYRFYLDSILDRTDGGLEVAGPPQRYVVNANWKIVAEGFYGDAYHVVTVHKSFVDIGAAPPGEVVLNDFKASINGHSVLCGDYELLGITGASLEVLTNAPPAGMPAELVPQLERHLSPEQIALLAQTPPSIAAIFPSTALVMIGGELMTGPLGQVLSLRFFVPLSPNKTEIMSFALVERDAPREFKERTYATSINAFSVSGFFEVDDVDVWAGVQRSVEGVIGRQALANYQAVAEPHADPIRPGSTHRGVSTDDNQWRFYERCFEYMGDRAW